MLLSVTSWLATASYFAGWWLSLPIALCSVALAGVTVRWTRSGWRVASWLLLAFTLLPFVFVVGSSLRPKADPARVVIACDVTSNQNDGVQFDSLADARASGRSRCLGFVQDGTLTQLERDALAAAGAGTDEYGLRGLYGLCAQSAAVTMNELPSPPSAAQGRELAGALVLCPDHPDRTALEQAVASASRD